MRVLWLLLFAGSMAYQDMDRSVFLFPKKSSDDYVLLTPKMTGTLNKFTVCLRSYTDGKQFALFTVGTVNSQIQNMFVIVQSPSGYFHIYVKNVQVSIPGERDVLEWNHICVTWGNGVLQLWVNGKVSPRTSLNSGYPIDLQQGISLGQMHLPSRNTHTSLYRYYGSRWDPEASFQGEISDVHMWDEVLPPETIRQVLLNNRDINGNVISWRSLIYTINGDVTVQPKLQCRYGSESGSSHYQCSMD
ncbi:C-reactive protein-like [Xenopus laevis]|uniref:Pentraxin family member n=2 Tax=Xenopus laevis TaxID=8355 RepID=A0A1L8FBP5_XENLA|nr:C-reactive protein-like [Xenopus laevis]XP_041428486.1 C-reactive protein-like [Xenopus laevis]OCT69014.1 hypothetical protein XELAEV_18040322mg [Xenopus laevis]